MNPSPARLMVSAAHKSSGKTTLSLGLAAAFAARGLAVQTFKKGPDYIDPMWLALASGRPCFNLDTYIGNEDAARTCFGQAAAGADLSLVEGNKGLFDGVALDGSNSNAALARLLGLPVLLVIDARGMTRGVAPLILGYQAFERDIRIGGVILNAVGGARHESKLRSVIEHYTDVPVLGAMAQDARLALGERHLGLVPAAEVDDAAQYVRRVAAATAAQVDLVRVLALARSAPPLPWADLAPASQSLEGPRLRIGVARDRAFGFYYAQDLAALEAAGAHLVFIDTLSDARLPRLDGLFIGGGFPEVHMDALEANAALRLALREAIADGLPVYAECGGLMYLARSLQWQGRVAQMVGAIPADSVMHERPVGRGYVHLHETGDFPWPAGAASAGCAEAEIRAHEFHHSSLENLDPGLRFGYRVTRGHGVDGQRDGLVWGNVLASYAHRRSVGDAAWAPRFVAFVRRIAGERQLHLGSSVPPAARQTVVA